MDWMKTFDEATLEKAYEDWLEGCIQDLSISDGDGLGWVSDEEDTYMVAFSLDDHQDPVAMTCTCPKAVAGMSCKHMAIIHYQLVEDKSGFSLEHLMDLSAPPFLDEYSLKNIHFLLGLYDPDLLSSFLLYLLNEDRSLLKLFWHGIYMNMPEEPDAIMAALEDLVCRFEDTHLFGDFYEADVFINEVIRLYVFGSCLLQEKKDVTGLLDFAFRFFSLLDEDFMDDHWDQLDLLCHSFLLSWKDALDKSGPRERQAMLRWYQDWQGLGGEAIQLFNDCLKEFFSLPAFSQKDRQISAGRRLQRKVESDIPSAAGGRPLGTVKALYPKELLASCQETAQVLASRAVNRQHYRDLVGFLREIQRIEGGNALVDSLVSRWRIEYKRRYALQEELDKL